MASSEKREKKGLLQNAFSSHKWDSRIRSANTTKKEMWLGYVLGVWGMMMTSSIVNSYYNQYLTDILGFTSSKGVWIATFMVAFPVLSKLLDAITNIIMSKLIDSTTCRQGKVRPWLLLSAPVVAVSIILLFWIPFTEPVLQAVWVVVAFNLYYSVTFTMWNMAKEIMPAVSTRNVNQRKNLSMAMTITSNIGTGLVSILFPTILALISGMVSSSAEGYLLTMSFIACLGVATTFVQYFYTRERITEERRGQTVSSPDAPQTIHREAGLMTQFRACMTTKYWIIFIVTILLTYILANMRNMSLVYYAGWVVQGNAYGSYPSVQAKFQMIALSPMGPGILLLLPLVKKWGRRTCCWVGGTLCVVGSLIAYLSPGRGMMIYAGTALGAIGTLFFNYTMITYMGDIIDYVEWKTKVRCDGLTGGLVSAGMMFATGIAQGLFNLGLMAAGYTTPEQIGVSENGVALYADQSAAATSWINFAYQGTYIIMGLAVFAVFLLLFDIEKHLPQASRELQERKVAECAALGIEYIPADELERREIEQQERLAEESRIAELRAHCTKRDLDFDTENRKVLEKRAAKQAKAARRRRR
ncbi:MAG: MFS transporter [Eubacteriales bacterium]|nr:MFS transporter [Eubacteriales bacterium]